MINRRKALGILGGGVGLGIIAGSQSEAAAAAAGKQGGGPTANPSSIVNVDPIDPGGCTADGLGKLQEPP